MAGVLAVAFDQVAHRHHELRLQQVDHPHGPRKNARPMPARAVGDDGKAKGVGPLVELELRPRIAGRRLGHDDRWFVRGRIVRSAASSEDRDSRQCRDDHADVEQSLHLSSPASGRCQPAGSVSLLLCDDFLSLRRSAEHPRTGGLIRRGGPLAFQTRCPRMNTASTEPGNVSPSNGDQPHFVFRCSRVICSGSRQDSARSAKPCSRARFART